MFCWFSHSSLDSFVCWFLFFLFFWKNYVYRRIILNWRNTVLCTCCEGSERRWKGKEMQQWSTRGTYHADVGERRKTADTDHCCQDTINGGHDKPLETIKTLQQAYTHSIIRNFLLQMQCAVAVLQMETLRWETGPRSANMQRQRHGCSQDFKLDNCKSGTIPSFLMKK